MNKGTFNITDSRKQSILEKKIDIPVVDSTGTRKQLIARIESITTNIIQQICSGQLPKVSHDLCENSNPTCTRFIEDLDFESQSSEHLSESIQDSSENDKKVVMNFASNRGKNKFALMMAVMAAAHRLLITNSTITRRSLYYNLKNEKTSNLVPEQRNLDQAINRVANLLSCAPWELNLLPTSKGLVAGDLTLTLVNNRIIDCSVPGGALIPHIASNIASIRAKARIILVVEKDAVFQKLIEDDCVSSLNCILVTGKGYPDVATRMLVKLLSEKLDLPAYIIVDADPFGVEIMCVYRFGSVALYKERDVLACPNLRWLGIRPSELLPLGVDTVPLTEFDLSKLLALESRTYMTVALLGELKILRNGKAEIESLLSISNKFLAATYLPCKIRGEDCI